MTQDQILLGLDARFRTRFEALLAASDSAGFRVVPYQGYRSAEIQAKLWRQSRTASEIADRLAVLRKSGGRTCPDLRGALMRLAESWNMVDEDPRHAKSSSDSRGGYLEIPSRQSEMVSLHRGSVGAFFLARCPYSGGARGPVGYMEQPHFVFPLAGSYIWHAGREDVFADANHVLSFPGREEYSISHPVTGDVSIAIWPSEDVAQRLYGERGSSKYRRIFGDRRSWPLSASAQLLSRQLVSMAHFGSSAIALDEVGLQLLIALDEQASDLKRAGSVNIKALRRAKEFIQTNSFRKLTLIDVAGAVGLHPVYLSQMFTVAEGIPLAQYMRKLRLAQTLNELVQCQDITALALDSGFSSHSHYTSAFNDVYMTTPSAVRALLSGAGLRRATGNMLSQAVCAAREGGPAGPLDSSVPAARGQGAFVTGAAVWRPKGHRRPVE